MSDYPQVTRRNVRVLDPVIVNTHTDQTGPRAGIVRSIDEDHAVVYFLDTKQTKTVKLKQLQHYVYGRRSNLEHMLKWSKIVTFPTGASIYLSGLPEDKWNKTNLKKSKIKAVISIMESEPSDIPLSGISHYFFKLDDRPEKEIKKYFNKSSSILYSNIRKGNSVLVHCVAGISRSVSLIIAFFLACLPCHSELVEPYIPETESSWTLSILNYIRTKRPIAGPNIGFINQLLKYEESMMEKQKCWTNKL